MRAYERLLKYACVHTTSSEEMDTTPSTARQFDLAKLLADEMKALGMSDVAADEFCYVYGSLPASPGCESVPRLGFIAHMDTSPDFSGENVRPQIIEDYDGGAVILGESGRALSPKMFPHLPKLAGRTLIVTDGTTLLGADDKAGIAEILTLVEELQARGTPHGRISVCFTPDEEVGRGTVRFDMERFGADVAYTLDGGEEGEVVFENFNACSAIVEFRGQNIHPGSAKGKMVNAVLVAMAFNAMLPGGDTPRHTEGYEGFFHLASFAGTVESARASYILRDHDLAKFEMRKQMMLHIEKLLNEEYGPGTVKLTFQEQYRNMAEKIMPDYEYLIERAVLAVKEAGLTPLTDPLRGGTDGALLSWKGLPCPNLGTGGYAFHGPYEHITAEGMDKCVEILHGIVRQFAK